MRALTKNENPYYANKRQKETIIILNSGLESFFSQEYEEILPVIEHYSIVETLCVHLKNENLCNIVCNIIHKIFSIFPSKENILHEVKNLCFSLLIFYLKASRI